MGYCRKLSWEIKKQVQEFHLQFRKTKRGEESRTDPHPKPGVTAGCRRAAALPWEESLAEGRPRLSLTRNRLADALVSFSPLMPYCPPFITWALGKAKGDNFAHPPVCVYSVEGSRELAPLLARSSAPEDRQVWCLQDCSSALLAFVSGSLELAFFFTFRS